MVSVRIWKPTWRHAQGKYYLPSQAPHCSERFRTPEGGMGASNLETLTTAKMNVFNETK
jgi:hypothetical protein